MRWEDCIGRDMGRVGGEWRTTAKGKRNWRLLVEKSEEKDDVTMVNHSPDDRDDKRTTRHMQYMTSVIICTLVS